MPRVSFTIRIDPDLLARMQRLARPRYWSTSRLIEIMLRPALKAKLHLS